MCPSLVGFVGGVRVSAFVCVRIVFCHLDKFVGLVRYFWSLSGSSWLLRASSGRS